VLSPKDAVKLGKYDVTGVGINLVISDDGAVKVGGVPPADSDAAVLGVEFGDVVLTINGKVCDGMTSFDALEAIQGDKDVVNLRIRSANGGGERDVSLRKTFTTRNPVSYKLVTSDDGRKTGYIKLSEFNAQCKKKVREAVRNLEAEGASGLVLDMRGNGGGVLDGAIGIAGLFMERPLVLYVTDANGAMQPLYSREAVVSTELPLQVWVDATTASSAEVLAAALRDNCRASVVGGTTYGKGVIQGVFGLSDGGALIETVASYATPAKEEINKRGVRPDEKKTFISDVMGSSWVDADIKAASLGQRSTATTCTDKPSAASTKMAATSASATRTD
jgi:carboxyl-terminal processing protease